MQPFKKALSTSTRAGNRSLTPNIPAYQIWYFTYRKVEDPSALLDNSRLEPQPSQKLQKKIKEGRSFVQTKIGGSDQVDRYGFPAPEKREGDYTAVSAIKDGWGPETSFFPNSFAPMSIESGLRDIVFGGDSDNILRKSGTRETFFLCYSPEYENDLLQGLTKVGQKCRGIDFVKQGVKAEDILGELRSVIYDLLGEFISAKIITEDYRDDRMKKFDEQAGKMTNDIEVNRKELIDLANGKLTNDEKLSWKTLRFKQTGYTAIGNDVNIDL
ncbi:unnamed protein product [Rhizoctonia solani]|uniref:Uncharacterized protein n=1 Tax=Rhizoctonia solani TaxID=456999 RepID=A0A8H2X8F4_9AGAM|nr:unnamed protein product [Rhizoctonia solani]